MHTAYLLLKGEKLHYGQTDMKEIKKHIVGVFLANMETIA